MVQTYLSTAPGSDTPLTALAMRNNYNGIASHHEGSSVPPSIIEGMTWLDTTTVNNGILKIRLNGAWHTFINGIGAIDSDTNPVKPKWLGGLKPAYTHTQGVASATWAVPHKILNQYPIVVVVDGSDITIDPATYLITYTDTENLSIAFSATKSGKALIY